MTIWGLYKPSGKIERVDSCAKSEAGYLCGEYQLAYGSSWVIWAGKKSDAPTGRTTHDDYADRHRYKSA